MKFYGTRCNNTGTNKVKPNAIVIKLELLKENHIYTYVLNNDQKYSRDCALHVEKYFQGFSLKLNLNKLKH